MSAPVQSYTAYLRDHHLMDLAAEELRLLAAQGLSPDAVGAREGASAAKRMVDAVERFLGRMDGTGRASDPITPAMGAIHQQAVLAFLDRYTREPQVILEIARALAVQVASFTSADVPPSARGLPATVAHDLRSPLNALSGALHVLDATLAGKVPESAERMLGIALRNTDKLADMIDALAPARQAP